MLDIWGLRHKTTVSCVVHGRLEAFVDTRLRAVSREEHLLKTERPQQKLCGVVQLEDGYNFQNGPGHVRKVHAGPEV
jgi:hypothetical protein